MPRVWKNVMTGRYGNNGSRAMFNWIQEHNPNLDASIYKKIQELVESGRNSFEQDQKMLLDKKREYQNYLETFPNNLLAGALRFPRLDMSKYDIVTSERTEKAFETKKDEPIKLR
jgi:hypothetical protein